MALSTNTLIHFTKTKETLKAILEENFRINLCFEQILLPVSNPEHVHSTAMYIPMVCFCDIPLSEIKDHMSKYGNYGLGMTKEWGLRNRLNPVLYLEKNSLLTKSFILSQVRLTQPSHEDELGATKALLDIFRYVKNYEGYRGKPTPNYRFYDEREWRYVPPYTSDFPMLLYALRPDPDAKAAADAKLADIRLKFESEDIRYIIINDDTEISEFVNHLNDVKGGKYSSKDIERLTTRILTSDQIMTDM